MNVLSKNIGVYPSAARGQQAAYSESRISTEANTARFTSNLIDTDGFIITNRQSWNSLSADARYSTPLYFNIYGYYFTVASPKEILDSFGDTVSEIYANIALQITPNSSDTLEQYELFGQDEAGTGADSYYRGLEFSVSPGVFENTPSGEYFVKSLLLFSKDLDGSWAIPKASTQRFSTDALRYDIDGGEIK